MKKGLICLILTALILLSTSCSSPKPIDQATTQPTNSDEANALSSGESSEQSANSESQSGLGESQPSESEISTSETQSRTVKVVIPEGFTVSQIAERLEANEVCSKADFLDIVNSFDFTYYPLVAKIPNDKNICYKLEGYLFPNTYELYRNMKPQDAAGKMLRSSEANIGSKYSYEGLTTHELITLASIIEKEASDPEIMAMVSSVFHNRLKTNTKIEADPTINYVEKYLKPNLTGDINRYNSYYNTYKCPALPAGPICNPGAEALNAAANPAQSEYFFFVFSSDGSEYLFAKTYDEHKENCKKLGI